MGGMDILNKVMLVGNLTRDPELRQTGAGKAVTDLSLALDGPGGTREEPEPVYVDVALWERNAENAVQYLKKGSPVLIEGRLRMDRWEDKETGQTRTKLKVTGDRMKFLNLAPREERRDESAREEVGK
jgi:single-strand DNA-binding protein